jgi:hypothetical protein
MSSCQIDIRALKPTLATYDSSCVTCRRQANSNLRKKVATLTAFITAKSRKTTEWWGVFRNKRTC